MIKFTAFSATIAGAAIATTTAVLLDAPAQALTLNRNTDVIVESIDDLDVGGALYDVTFKSGAFDDLFDPDLNPGEVGADGRRGPTFWGDKANATKAAQAIIDTLGSGERTSNQHDNFGVPWGFNASNFVLYADDTGFDPSDDSIGLSDYVWKLESFPTQPYATFAPAQAAPIPTPAMLPGLIGMGIAALRKRHSAQAD
ncbi:PTPA-CTERM sorting domain-containing protein [filamentous cyanobacterium LEGE 11480]|uniref:PTPA-CTERM sorting domain-containing protein n=1 Tax=Romeriopsis navalis LEGE 11480 TaxID=2777977 RepID=A0A928VP93_9CYAN|nr:PTPA-CTERM sorting domain-containing protein [Romeriopsis navalis]MBE9029544.1 PTPA-CTERM sorting domain-containing protein [Romeriopsis navalis LEGE 11480]